MKPLPEFSSAAHCHSACSGRANVLSGGSRSVLMGTDSIALPADPPGSHPMNRWLLTVAGVCLTAPSGFAADPVDYARDVKPIFKERCYACHGALKQKGKLRLDTVALMTTGGKSGAAITPGDPAASLLLERV